MNLDIMHRYRSITVLLAAACALCITVSQKSEAADMPSSVEENTLSMQQDTAVPAKKLQWYAGFNAGKTDFDDDGLYSGDLDKNDTSWSLYGGVRFNNWLSAEIQYSDLGSYALDNNESDVLRVVADNYRAMTASSRFHYGFNDYVECYVKTGISMIYMLQDVSVVNRPPVQFDALAFYFAGGVAINLSPSVTVTAQYDSYFYEAEASNGLRHEFFDQRIAAVNLGLELRF